MNFGCTSYFLNMIFYISCRKIFKLIYWLSWFSYNTNIYTTDTYCTINTLIIIWFTPAVSSAIKHFSYVYGGIKSLTSCTATKISNLFSNHTCIYLLSLTYNSAKKCYVEVLTYAQHYLKNCNHNGVIDSHCKKVACNTLQLENCWIFE